MKDPTTNIGITIDVLAASRGDCLWIECTCGEGPPWRLLVDGGMPDAASQFSRVNAIMMEQTRALRRREIVDRFDRSEKNGAFWGIGTRIAAYGGPNTLAQDTPLTESLKLIRTRLNRFSDDEQGHLINSGYALVDAAFRKYIGVPPAATTGAWPDQRFPL